MFLFNRLYLPSVKVNNLISFRGYRNSLDSEANESTVSPASARFFSIRRAVASSSRSTPTNDTTNLSARSGLFAGSPTEFQSFLLRLPDWKMEVGEESLITRDNDCRCSLLAVLPPVDHRLRRTGFYLDSLWRSNSKDIRSKPMPYTRNNNNGNNGHGLGTITNTNSLIPLAALQLLLTIFPFQTSISIKGAYLTIFSILSLGRCSRN